MSPIIPSLLVLVSLLHIAHAACHFPNGDVATLDVACDASATDSFCCFSNQACLSNKLCYDPATEKFARGTCTDRNWQSSACPRFCNDAEGLGNPVLSCNSTSSGDSYCCNNGCSCASGNEVISFVGEPYIMTIIGKQQTFANPSLTSSVTSSTTDSATSSTSTSASSSSTSSHRAAAPTSAAASSVGPGLNSTAAVGIGVGVGVGAIAILVAAFAFFMIRRRRARNSAGAMNHGLGGGAANQLPYYSNSAELDSRQNTVVQDISSEGGGQSYMSELPAESVSWKYR